MTKLRLIADIPNDKELQDKLCAKIINRLITQINKGKTFRELGDKTRVSYETLRTLYNDPDHSLSRKSKIMLIRTCTRRDLFQTVKIIHKEKGIFTCPK